jgi:GNAT superfamily N-acetyltransferase
VGAERGRRGGAEGLALIADADDRDVVRALFREYAASLDLDGHFEGFDDELAQLPYEALLVASLDGEAVGCVALRRLDRETCEMKRMFVRPAARGTGAGRALALASLERARALGYRTMRLDTLPDRMEAAGKLYRSLGFVEVGRYNDNPIAGVIFMELQL